MKTIKAVTDFGTIDVKTIGTKKEICGELWQVVHYPVKYMNMLEPLMIRKALHFKTGMNLPLSNMKHNSTANDFFSEAEKFLRNIGVEAITKELSDKAILNN